jgi:Spy/CpxP family protein refolding chaperone
MKRRWIGVMLGVPIMVAPITTSVALAEPASLTQLFPALVGIQLTPEQQAQLGTLTNETLPKVQSVLTPEQQTQFNTALTQGKGVRVALLSLNLSIAQQMQLRHLLQSARSQVTQTLTPEQQQQLRSNVQSFQNQGR